MELADKKINSMEMRKHLGRFLNRVFLKNEEFTIFRCGKPVARLVPLKNETLYDTKLSDAIGMGQEVWEKTKTDEYVNRLRDAWQKY